MKIIYTHPTLALSEKEYNAFDIVQSVLYKLAINTYYADLFENLDDNDNEKNLIRNLANNIDNLYELTADFISFIDKYGKVTKEN